MYVIPVENSKARNMYAVVHRIFEKAIGDDYPVVTHIFYGKTRDEAMRYYKMHRTTDQFLRDCTDQGHWMQVECRSEMSVYRVLANGGWYEEN